MCHRLNICGMGIQTSLLHLGTVYTAHWEHGVQWVDIPIESPLQWLVRSNLIFPLIG
jgi:hypothetical protein